MEKAFSGTYVDTTKTVLYFLIIDVWLPRPV